MKGEEKKPIFFKLSFEERGERRGEKAAAGGGGAAAAAVVSLFPAPFLLHLGVVGPPPSLGHGPHDVPRRLLDVARLAVQAVLRVDPQLRLALLSDLRICQASASGGAALPRRRSTNS